MTPSLYTSLTKLVVEDSDDNNKPQVEDAARFQARQSWLNSTITKEHLDNIQNEISRLLKQSVDLSVSYPSHQNHNQIIHNLIRVDTLKKLIESYDKLNRK